MNEQGERVMSIGAAPGELAGPPARGAARRRGRALRVERPWPAWQMLACQLGILVLVIALWEVGARYGWIDTFYWSSPSQIWAKFIVFVGTGQALVDTAFTFKATLLGFVLGTLAGTLVGLSFWWSRNYAAMAQPFLICFEATPKLALAPMIVIVFGTGLAPKVAIGIALTIIVTALTTSTAIRSIDPDSERLFYSLGASRRQVFAKLVVPSVLPWIISSLRINIGLALTGAVIGEFVSSQHGLGRQILYAGQVYDVALIWVAVGVLATLSIAIYIAVGQLEKILLKSITAGAMMR
jgi:NitT/TauT family transport system permease protein